MKSLNRVERVKGRECMGGKGALSRAVSPPDRLPLHGGPEKAGQV